MRDVLTIKINNIRGIKSLEVDLNLKQGIYAFTGQNASGKSTLIASLASIFYRQVLPNFFRNSSNNALISYNLDGDSMTAKKLENSKFWDFNGDLLLNGFYEGSIIHGNRFRDTNYKSLYEATKVSKPNLIKADDFVIENLGIILQDDANHYADLYRLKKDDAIRRFNFRGSPYFLFENSKIISQFSLSTGENLLISLLHSLNFQLIKKPARDHYIVLLDEIELALHPSALVRLVKFLTQIARQRNIAIYFSTHSVELIRQIPAENIYYLQKHSDKSVEVINPCYPSYATRNISIFDGYDLLILVEDYLARKIVETIIRKHDLNKSKLIHVIPAGGWENTLSLHNEITDSELLGAGRKVISILDGDIENQFNDKYKSKGLYSHLNITFLPIESIEKFLLKKLVIDVDHSFFRHFGDSFFKKKSLDCVVKEFQKEYTLHSNGKNFYKLLISNVTSVNVPQKEFELMVSDYILKTKDTTPLARRLKNAIV